jgi:hypothetical protein
MPRSNRRLKLHLKNSQQQLAAALVKGDKPLIKHFQRMIVWIKAQQQINKKPSLQFYGHQRSVQFPLLKK